VPEKQESEEVPIRVDHLTPDRVLDIAYCCYLTSVFPDSDEPTLMLARSLVEKFRLLCDSFSQGSKESDFIFSIQSAVISLARGIGRRQRARDEKLQRAKEEKDRRVQQLSQGPKQVGALRALGRLVIMAGFGYMVTRSFLPWVDFDKPVQPTYVSMAAGLGTAIIGAYLRSWLISRHFRHIFDIYDRMVIYAEQEYRRGALEEYVRTKRDAARAWTSYMNCPVTEWPGYETLMAEEIALHEKYQNDCDRLKSSVWGQIISSLYSRMCQRTKRR
jgi:hypothetical protein